MKKILSLLYTVLFMLMFSGICFLAGADELATKVAPASDFVTHSVPVSDIGSSFFAFLADFLPDNVMLLLTGIMTICASLATFLPPIKADSSSFYSSFYKFIQFLALNLGHAKNAQDRK